MSTTTTHIEKLYPQQLLKEGFTSLPNTLCRIYRKLGISHGEFGLIVQILTHKHDERNPFPSYSTLAEYLDVSTKQIQNWVKSLVNKGYLNVQQRKLGIAFGSNEYDFTPLVEACLNYLGIESSIFEEAKESEVPTTTEENISPKMTSSKTKTEEEDVYKEEQNSIFIQEFIEECQGHSLPQYVIQRLIPAVRTLKFNISTLRLALISFKEQWKSGGIKAIDLYFKRVLEDKQAVSDYNRMVEQKAKSTSHLQPFPFYNWLES